MREQEKPLLPVDPIPVFLAGALVGLTVGEQVIGIARGLYESRKHELAEAVLKQFTQKGD